ncbi:MAG: pitrilysin family protein [Planctomycetota bacterium]
MPDQAPLRADLDNGMVFIVKEDHAAPIVTLQAWFRAGSIFEEEFLGCGISHFVEHMIFKGTPTRGVGAFANEIRAAGGDLNAYTFYDRTVFYCTVRSPYLDPALDALSDVVKNSAFDPAETAKESEVIVKELEKDLDTPDQVLYHLFQSTAYQVHPYRIPVGGYIDQFKRIGREDLVRYYRRMYVPNNMIFVVVGDVDGSEAARRVERSFADFERRPRPPITLPREPRQLGRREASREADTPQTKLMLGWPTIAVSHPDLYALDVLSLVLGHGRASRLARIVKDKRRLVSSIDASSDTPLDPGTFYVWADGIEPDRFRETCDVVLEEAYRLRDEPVTAAELDRAKNQVLANFVYSRQGVEAQARSLGTGECLAHNIAFDALYVDGIRRVRPEQVLDAARRYLTEETLTVASVVPRSASVSVGGSTLAAASEPPPTGGVRVPDVAKSTLPGGGTLLVRPNRTLPLVTAYAAFLGGVRFEPPDRAGVSAFMASAMTRGTRRRTAEELHEAIESVGGRLEQFSGKNSFGLQVTCLTEHLDLALGLFGECLTEPAFDPDQIELVRRLTLSAIARQREDAMTQDMILLNRSLYGEHPYGRPQLGREETVCAIGREDLAAFHAAWCRSSNAVVAVVGDVSVEEAQSKIATVLAGLSASPVGVPVLPSQPRIGERSDVEQTIPGKNLGALCVGFPTVSFRHPDGYVLDVIQQLLSGLGGRIFVRLREEQALAYEVHGVAASNLDPGAFLFMTRTTRDKFDACLDGLADELARLAREPIPEDELARAKNSLVGSRIGDLQRNQDQAQGMALDELYGLGYEHYWRYLDRVEAVGAEDVRRVARAYLDMRRCVVARTLVEPATAAEAAVAAADRTE